MTKPLEALIAEMKAAADMQDKYMRGGAFSLAWDDYITPQNIKALIAALEQSQQQNKEFIDERTASTLEMSRIIQREINLRRAAENALLDAGKRIAELEVDQATDIGMQLITEAIGAHGYIVASLVQGRPDLALAESRKWAEAFTQAAGTVGGG